MATPDAAHLKVTREWPLSHAATFGSAVRARGILLELLARLPKAKKALGIKAGVLILSLPASESAAFEQLSTALSQALQGIELLPIIPREIEDILAISATERHRWLKDGRLQSAGTRTVKLKGRARQVTFHVFDPRLVEDLLDRDLIATWREDDAERAAENRRWAAEKRAHKRLQGQTPPKPEHAQSAEDASRFQLEGWAEFEKLGLLR